jgi:diaminohydroxyphosphoribosylaminopyrimidine deaminase/5-amino-6-(5-phosphoribosylamino)uracil reductase
MDEKKDSKARSRLTPAEAMARAIEVAKKGPEYGPNPRVGCVIVDKLGQVIGEGYHRGAGTTHAEVAAIADAAKRGSQTAGATAYMTLEPCRHVGRTGPCVDALTEAGITRVVYAVPDPGTISGGGAEVLKKRGVEVILEPSQAAEDIIGPFLHAHRKMRPFVILKFATTLDGRTAAVDGTSLWITSDEAREHSHRGRGRADAIVVGTGTIMADDPMLSARPGGKESGHQPLRVAVGLRDTAGKNIWRDENALQVWTHDPRIVLRELHEREVRSAIIEGGATLNSAFIRAGLVDEVHAYVAPALLGAGRGVVNGLGIQTIGDALRLTDVTTIRLGDDTLVIGRPNRQG